MAASKISGVAVDSPDWVGKALKKRFGAVRKLRKKALDFSDEEGVHQMRVATRRLRSALRDFRPLLGEARFGKFKRDLRRVADALGAVRDEDVAIAELRRLAEEAPDESVRNSIDRLIGERAALRNAARTGLGPIIRRKFLIKLGKRLKRAVRRAKLHSGDICGTARTIIGEGRRQLLELSPSLKDPNAVEELHRLRIAAKRLRYALELFEDCGPFGPGLGDPEGIAELQTHLGEMHDRDVWIGDISARADEEDHRWLTGRFREDREKHYRLALGQWSRIAKAG